jgi:uncharacterized RDD family membrane protein YckC
VSDAWRGSDPARAADRAPSGLSLPPGLAVAGIGSRVGAFVIDLLFFGLVSLVPGTIAVLSGGVTLNPAAMDQIAVNPNAYPSVPFLFVNLGPLILCAVIWVALAIAYGAASWTRFRGTPGQLILSLQVADAATGASLGILRSALRSILLFGIPAAAAAAVTVAMCQVLTIVVPADFQKMGNGSASLATYGVTGAWVGLVPLGFVVALGWPAGLLFSVFSRDHRGFHDRLSGSAVVSRTAAPNAWGMPYAPGAGAFPAPGPMPGAAPGEIPGTGEPEVPAPNSWPGVLSPGQPSPWTTPQPWSATPPPSNAAPSPDAVPPEGWISPAGEAMSIGRQGPLGSKLPEGLRIARFNRRIGAYGIDCAIAFFAYLMIASAVAGPDFNGSTPLSERQAMTVGLASGMVQLVYFVATWRLLRGSLGQKLGGLEVTSESGGRLGMADALARWAVLQGPFALVTAAPVAIAGIAGICAMSWAVFGIFKTRDDPDGQGYHDRIAHSLVVESI